MKKILAGFAAALAVVGGTGLTGQASAQDAYPSRTVTIVVPFAAGGTTDMLGRILAERLGQRMKGSFIVENRAGAGGNTGVAAVAKAAPDGYTLTMGTVSTHAINPNVYKRIPFDHVKDFAPVSLVASVPNILLVNADLPVKTVPELVALLKKEPGKHAFASSGAGTSIHLAGELFKISSGTDIAHVPYRSSGQITTDLLSGQIMMTFDNITVAWPHVEAGKLRALATATPERLSFAPDIPTMSEFYPGFAATSWHGLFRPGGDAQAHCRPVVVGGAGDHARAGHGREAEEGRRHPRGLHLRRVRDHIAKETARWKDVAAKANISIE